MGLTYHHLDDRTRQLMLAEIELDIRNNHLFISENLTPSGQQDFPELLRSAVANGDDNSLAFAIRGRLNSHEKPRRLKTGGYSKPPVMRSNFHELLAESEFNRFYIRALCVRAIADGIAKLVVYRAKSVANARSESEQKIGTHIQPDTLLSDLRTHQGVETAFGLPPGPNSGLCVRLPSSLV